MTIHNYLHSTLNIVYEAFKDQIVFPSRETRNENSRNFEDTQISVVIDGSEQQCYVSETSMTEKNTYSGKKKKHTLTKMVVCSPRGHIYYLSPSYGGSRNDMMVYDFPENHIHIKLDQDEAICSDLGYRGLQNYHLNVIIPSNRKNMQADEEERECNKKSIRVMVENVIRRIKEWKICKEKIRFPTDDLNELLTTHHKLWTICSVLVNKYHKK